MQGTGEFAVVRRGWRLVALLGFVLGGLLLQVAPAGAVPRHTPPMASPQVRGNTEMTVTSWSPGQGVAGFIADKDNPFDPATAPYPPSNPATGWTSKNESFAGVIHGTPTGGGTPLNLYCIDINTDTTTGIGYELGNWDAGGVSPRVGYVARLLNDYYPHTDEPAALTDLNQKAAAVQASMWFFSDRYVPGPGRPAPQHRGRHRDEGPTRRPAQPAATAHPHHHSADSERSRWQRSQTVHGQHRYRAATGAAAARCGGRHRHRNGGKRVL